MIECCGPGTVTGSPARADASAQAASIGSSPISRGVSAGPARKWRAAAAASEPTPIGTMTRSTERPSSCASSSAKIVP